MPIGVWGSNPGRPGELFQNQVAMSNYTNWPPELSTIMVISQCTVNIQTCMIHFCVRTNVLIKMMCHRFLNIKYILSYDNICNWIFVCWIAVLPDFFNIDNGQSVTEMVKMTLMLLMTVWLLSNAAKKLTRPGFTKGYQIPSMGLI